MKSPNMVPPSDLSPLPPSLSRVTSPGLPQLGRSVVIGPGASAPDAWADADRFLIDQGLLDDSHRLEKTVDELQRRYVERVPTVVVLDVDPQDLARAETTDADPYELGATFSFLREQLAKLV